MQIEIDYRDLSPTQKLKAFWHSFADADPVPPEFCDDMESAGFAELVPVDAEALEDAFAYERGIVPGGMMWRLTDAGRLALSQAKEG